MLLQLPDELLIKIFSELSLPARLRAERVCQKWKTLIQYSKYSQLLAIHPCLPDEKRFFYGSDYKFVYAPYEDGESLEESSCAKLRLNTKQAARFLAEHPFVKRVRISSDHLFHSLVCLNAIKDTTRSFDDVQVELHQNCRVGFLGESIFIDNAHCVTKLILHSQESLGRMGAFSNLQELVVHFDFDVTQTFITHLPESITGLWLPSVSFTDEDSLFELLIQKFSGKLNKFCAETISMNQLEKLAERCTRLTTLNVEADTLPDLCELSCISNLVNLEHLKIAVDTFDFYRPRCGLINFVKPLKKLKTLALGEIFNTKSMIDILVEHCQTIFDLQLDYWIDFDRGVRLDDLSKLARLRTFRFVLGEHVREYQGCVKLIELSKSIRNIQLVYYDNILSSRVARIADALNEKARENPEESFCFSLENLSDIFVGGPNAVRAPNLSVTFL